MFLIRNPLGLKRVTAPCVLGNKLLNIQFAKYHIWNNKSEGFPNMVLSTETFGNCEEELPKKPVGRLSVNCRPTVGDLLATCR